MPLFASLSVGVDLASGDHLVGEPRELGSSCRAAIDRAVWIARKFGSELHVVTALDVDAHAEDLILKQHERGGNSLLDYALRALDSLTERARDDGLRVSTGVAFGPAARVLADDAAARGRNLVVVGASPRGRQSSRRTALQLLRHCPVPVWIARPRAAAAVRDVIAAVDHRDLGEESIDVICRMCSTVGARLHVAHALDERSERVLRAGRARDEVLKEYRTARRSASDDAVARVAAAASRAGIDVRTTMREGDPTDVVLAVARESRADLVVLCVRVHGALHAAIWGSVAENLLARGAPSLLVLRDGRPAARREARPRRES
jgi:nucleotide-binding universal stress UspA family protein